MATAAAHFLLDMRRNTNPRWLVFLGKTGTGKTHITKAIKRLFGEQMDGLIIPDQDPLKTQHRMRGHFVSWRKACDRFRSGDYGTRDMEEDYLLCLDDIGAEYKAKTDFITSKLDGILDARLNKWTVITANLNLQQIAEFLDVRIASRLMRGGSEIIEVNTADFNTR